MEEGILNKMTNKHYILDENKNLVEVDLMTWANFFESFENRKVAQETLEDGTFVSTVFLGLDHNFSDNGPPLIFETMVFSPEEKKVQFGDKERIFHEDLEQSRYSTWEEAMNGHRETVERWKIKTKKQTDEQVKQ